MTTQTSRLVIEIDSRNAERNTRAVANELENLTTRGARADTQMTAMSSSIKSLVGYMGGLLTINKAIAMADGYTQMAARIRNATKDAAEYDLVQNRVLATANTTYRSLGEAQEVYLSLSGGMKSLGKSTTETLDLVDSLSFSFTHNATRTDQAQSAMDSLSKSMAKGKIDADAWISIVTGADNIIADMARTTGKTEAEIRQLGASGKASLEDLIKTLIATREQNEKLANNMENSLADGFTSLSNAVTVYLGKANESTSATGIMAGALGALAKNLESVANVAMLGGVTYLTKTIIAQTVAIRGSIAASTAKKVALETEVASQLKLLSVEVQRSRQAAAQTLTELNLARVELNSATTRDARAAATMRLTQAEVAHNIALKQSAAAVATQVTAEANLAATRTAGARALALVGGPIGAITIGVTALAAGYMLLSNNSNESTKSLRENNEAVGDAIVKYRELNGIQRDAQMAAERQKLEELNEAYRKASAELMVYASNMGSMGEVVTESQIELSKLFAEYKKTADLNAFNTSVQNSSKVSQDAKDKTANFAKAVFEAGSASKTQKEFIAQLSGELNSTANAGNNAAAGVRNLASALSEVNSKLSSDLFNLKMEAAFERQGKSARLASRLVEIYNENAKQGFKGITVEQMNTAKAIEALEVKRDSRLKAQSDAQKVSSKASKAALTQQKKDTKEADRLKEEQYNLRERIAYDYKDRTLKIEKDLQNEIADIQKANFSPKDTAGYIENAKHRAELEKKLYVAQLTENVSAWNLSEERKLELKKTVNNLMIQLDADMNDDFKNQALQSAEDQYQHELGLIKLAKEQRIFQAEQAMYSEMDVIRKRYELEREEIAKTAGISSDEKVRRLSASQFNQKQDESDLTKSLMRDYMGVMGFEENPLIQQFEVLQKARENDLINEEEYQNAKLQLQAKSTASYMEGMFGGFAELVDENSKTYAVLFAAQKAFAVAQAMLNIPQAYSKAYDAVVGTPYIGPYIAPAIGAAAAALQVAQAASIKNVSMGSFATGGFTGIGGKFDPAGIVHKGEVVWSQEDIKRWGGVNVVEAMRTSQPPKGYSDGGLVTPKDTYRVGMGTVDAIERGANVQAERQAQANVRAGAGASANVNLNPNFVIVDERESLSDYLFSPDGTKAFVKFFKRNRSALGV